MTQILVRAVVDVSVDAEQLAKLNRTRRAAGMQDTTPVDEVERRIADAFGGLCEVAQHGAKVSAAVVE